ncbi:glycosyltransferase family 8 protein [Myceligenerans crystallogenes]|uniref:Lipopolysaccharide biosynthesis protein, LPS:glycosyltransferase n=1 Tax=Myceligenerans crystallogenes TaxID=316335 RepID=A0ABN2NBJ2_9MICO
MSLSQRLRRTAASVARPALSRLAGTAPAEKAKALRRYVLAYDRIVAILGGETNLHARRSVGAIPPLTLTAEQELDNRRRARATVAKADLARALERGLPLEGAVVAGVRGLIAARDDVSMRSLNQSLMRDDATRVAGALGEAVAAEYYSFDNLAWTRFNEVPLETAARWAAREYARVAARKDPSALDALADVVLAQGEADFDADGALGVLEAALVTHRGKIAARLYERLAAEVPAGPDAAARPAAPASSGLAARLDWLAEWVRREAEPADPAPVADGAIPFAVMGYRTPDRRMTTQNIGDYVQTIAASSHLVRRGGLTFTGQPDLAASFEKLAARVPAEHRLAGGPEREIHLVELNRDASSSDPIPQDTWTLGFGWYMNSAFGLLPDFPFHPNLHPILVSFHVNRLELLTPEAVEYLKAHGPVGCRDWNTVYLLLAAGVPAFFSGCLTTTVNQLFEPRRATGKPAVYVDTPAPRGAATIAQEYDAVRDRSLAENIDEAVRLLSGYQTDYSRIVTSRLHCFLPTWAIGADVEFRPKRAGDIRFNGLLDATEADRRAMQSRITRLLDVAFTEILAGKKPEEVYAAWAEACAPEVEAARARLAAPSSNDPLPFDLDDVVARVLAREQVKPSALTRDGDAVHVSIAMDGNLKEQAKVVATALADHSTSRPVVLYVQCRDHSQADIDAFNALFPELEIHWLPCDGIGYGDISGMLSHITVATMDRLLLPYLLPDVGKVIYHDIDAVLLTDIAELYDTELGDAPLAARDAAGRYFLSGFRNTWVTTKKMPGGAEVANEFLRRMSAHQTYDYVAFNAGIMVLNLDRMRADGFAENFLPWAGMYGLNDQQLLNLYAGNSRVVLGPEWNAFPAQEDVVDPKLIHWAGHRKPWSAEYSTCQEHWQAAEERLAERAAAAAR